MKFTYDDLQWFQEDRVRRELIDGDLYIDGAPADRAQQTVACLVRVLGSYASRADGVLVTHRLDRTLDEAGTTPDLLFVKDVGAFEESYPDVTPDLAVEVVTDPASRGPQELDPFARRRVAEVWFVALDRDVIEAYLLKQGRYGDPVVFRRGDTVTATAVPGFSAAFDRLVPPA